MGKSDALSQRSDHGSGTEDNRDLTLLTPGLFAIRALEGLQVAGIFSSFFCFCYFYYYLFSDFEKAKNLILCIEGKGHFEGN